MYRVINYSAKSQINIMKKPQQPILQQKFNHKTVIK